MSLSRSASLKSVSDAAQGCTSCSGMIRSCFSQVQDVSIGSPPVVDDPFIKTLFGDTNVDNKSDYDMIDRMLRGEVVVSPEALTALSPIDVQAVTNDADRILKKVESRRRSEEMAARRGGSDSVYAGSPAARSHGSPVARDSSGTSSLTSSNTRSRSSSLSHFRRPNVVKKGAGKRKKAKEKSLDKKHRKVQDKSVGTDMPPPKPSPPVQLLPTCSLCEHNAYVGDFGFAPCAAYGDYMVNYCHDDASVAKKASSAPWDAQGAGPTGDSPSSKSLPAKSVVKRSYRKKSGKDGDKRRTSVCVEETATSEAIELLGGNLSRQAGSGFPSSTLASLAPTGPRASVRQYRYVETRRPAPALAGQLPWSQFSPPFSPHPLCPVHSPQPYGGAPPFLPPYGSPPTATQGPHDARPQAWWEDRAMPSQPLFPPTGNEAPWDQVSMLPREPSADGLPFNPWDSGAQLVYAGPVSAQTSSWYAPQLQPQQGGGPFPPVETQLSAPTVGVAPPADYYGYSSLPAGQWPREQGEQFPPQNAPDGPTLQIMRGAQQEELQNMTADQYRKSPTSMRTYPWFQFPSIPDDLDNSLKWGRTVDEAHNSGTASLNVAQNAGGCTERKVETFVWSSEKLKPHTRRPSRGLNDLGEQRRRPSECLPIHHGRRSPTAQDREGPRLEKRRRPSECLPIHHRRRPSTAQDSERPQPEERRRPPVCPPVDHQRRPSVVHDREMPYADPSRGHSEHGKLRRRSSVAHVDSRRSSVIDGQRIDQRRRSSSAQHEGALVNRRRSTDIRRASDAGKRDTSATKSGYNADKLQGQSSQRHESHMQPRALISCCAKCPHFRSASAHRGRCQLAQHYSTCSVCRARSSALPVHTCRHRCHDEQPCGSLDVHHTQCSAATRPICQYRDPSMVGHFHRHKPVWPSWEGRCASLRATPVCSHGQVTSPIETHITNICSVSPPPPPPLLKAVLPTELTMPTMPGLPGFQPQTDNNEQYGEDVYILLPTPSGEEKLYQARPLSPVLQLARSREELEHEGRNPWLSASAINAGLLDVRTWESERHEAPKISPVATKTDAELRKPGRCSSAGSLSSISLNAPSQPGLSEGYRQGAEVQEWHPDTQPASTGRKSSTVISQAEQTYLVSKEQDDPTKPGSKRTFAALAGPEASEGEQPPEVTKRPSIAPGQRSSGTTVPDQDEPGGMSNEENASRRHSRAAEIIALEQDLKRKASQGDDRTDVFSGGTPPEEAAEQVEPVNDEDHTKLSSAEQPSGAKEPANENAELGELNAESTEAVAEATDKGGECQVREALICAEVAAPEAVNQMPEIPPDAEFRKETAAAGGLWPLYPESRMAMLIGLVCLVWLLFVYLISGPHDDEIHTTETDRRTPLTFPTTPYSPPFTLPTHIPLTTFSEEPLDVYLCSTDVCIKEGERLRRHISREWSPCNNFYRYVCSSWEDARAENFGDGVAISVDTAVEEALAGSLRDYILDERNSGVGLVRDLYRTCVDLSGETSAFLHKEVFATLPIRTWPFNSSYWHAGDIWRMAGLLIRRYGIVSLLDVFVGVQRGRANHTVELSYPRHLYFNEWPNSVVLETLKSAVLEAAQEFGRVNEAETLMMHVVSVVKTLAEIGNTKDVWTVMLQNFADLTDTYEHLLLFLRAVFEDDVVPATTIVLRSPFLLAYKLQKVTSDEDAVVPFLNYLGFRVLVHFSPFLEPKSSSNLRRILAMELAGRALTPDLDWLLCLRMIQSAQPECLSKALAIQQSVSGTYAPSRIWLGQLEDQFYRNLRRVKWMSRKSVAAFAEIIGRFYVARYFAGSLLRDDLCPDRLPGELGKSSSISMFVRAAGDYQLRRLRQIREMVRPRDYGSTFDTQSRYSVAQQAVYVPVGLLDVSLPVNNTLLVYQASRSAVRLYLGLLPLIYERWDSNEDCEINEVLSDERSIRRLALLLKCLERDWQEMPQDLRLFTSNVVKDSSQAVYPLLAQTAAVALAYAAFKGLLSVERIWQVDFRLQSLPDVTSEQLFFLYYALDNCERSDDTYQAHQFRVWSRLPPEYRVNLPLRHLPQFARAFRCSASGEQPDPMAAPSGRRCDAVVWNTPPARSSGLWLAQRSDDANIPAGFLASQTDAGPATNVTDDGAGTSAFKTASIFGHGIRRTAAVTGRP